MRKPERIDVRVPTEEEILENPRRAWFVCGGWIDSDAPSVVNVYWHRRQRRFSVYSLLQILEHEILHAVLARFMRLEVSTKLDSVHRSVFVLLGDDDKGVFVNEFRIGNEWVFPPYLEEPTEEFFSS
jgi:hypothetical protein